MAEFPLGAPEVEAPVKLYYATVVSVDESRHVCDLRVGGQRGFNARSIPYCTPMLGASGYGYDYVPYTGSTCIVATELSNAKSPADSLIFILCFAPRLVRDHIRYPSAEGDISLSSSEGNRLELLNDGTTKLTAHEECSIELYPNSSKIETYCSNKVIKTAGGSVEWLTEGEGEESPTSLKAVVKTTATRTLGKDQLFVFEAGDTGVAQVTAKILSPRDPESPGRILWSGNEDGNISIESSGSLSAKYGGSSSTEAQISYRLKSPVITFETNKSSIKVEGPNTVIDTESLTIKADSIRMKSRSTNQVFFNSEVEDVEDTLNKQLVTEDVLGWLFNHVHPQAGLPPVGAPLVTSETAPLDPEEAQALLLAKQAEALLFNSDQLLNIEVITTAVTALENSGVLGPIATPVRQILDILRSMVRSQKEGYIQALSGISSQGSGVLYSYGQVLTQDTKVR